ncbi:MAG: SDR family oxidoreductase [Sandaracinaceae bacterium]|nr:SDR family oxidoreductase [Sandaracinaceae bacterium]
MRLAVITGASSGIGAASARTFAASGYKVVLVARGRTKLEELAASLGANAIVEACDASDGRAVVAMAERVLREHGTPDVLINAAGAGEWKFVEDTSPAEALVMAQAPYLAAFNATHAFMNAMLAKKSGVVIHVGSPVSLFAWPGCTGYAASRWALRGLNEALNQDLAGTGVRSCHVVFARVSSAYFANNPGAEEKIPGIANLIRTLTPEECASVLVKVAKRPRRQIAYPFMLSSFVWLYAIMPGLIRALLRWTGARRLTAH